MKAARILPFDTSIGENGTKISERREKGRMNGKQAIRMSDSTRKRRRKNNQPSGNVFFLFFHFNLYVFEGESFALRKMEPFVCAFFCEKCQAGSHYDGSVLSIETCDRCRSRFVNNKM